MNIFNLDADFRIDELLHDPEHKHIFGVEMKESETVDYNSNELATKK